MKRTTLWVTLGMLTACAGRQAPQASPEPAAPSTADVAIAEPGQAVADIDTAQVALEDSSVTAEVDSEAAADAAILERLANADPAPQDSGTDADAELPGGANSISTDEVSYDIDVSTYGNHARVQYYLDFFQGPARERFAIWLRRMPLYEPMIRAKLKENGVPEDMVFLALIESGFSNTAVSRARATGMWQFMKGTAKLYGLRIDGWVDERRDPYRATDAAARHLADLRDRFGSMYLAAAAYNAGAGKVGRGLRRLPDDDDEEDDNPDATFFRLYDTRFLRRETKDYVPKLIAAALIAKQPEKYGFEKVTDVEPLGYDSIIVPDATGLDVIAKLADTSVTALRELNPQYVRMVTPPKQPATVRLPLGRGESVASRFADLPRTERISFLDHVVARGQTLSGIAAMYHISTSDLMDANPGLKATRLRIGTRLVVPTSSVPAAAAPRATTRTTRPSATATSTTIRYRVRSGESLWTISQKYGTTVSRLRTINALGSRDVLRAGQVIRVPAPAAQVDPEPESARTHLVRPGETLSGIAAHYSVSLAALRTANGLDRDSILRSGTRLTIP